MKGLWAMCEEVSCLQAMGAKGGHVRKVWVVRVGLDVEGERGGEAQGRVVTVNVGQQEMIRMHGISCHE